MNNESPFLFPGEVNKITRLCDMTLSRMEKNGIFPRRVRIAPRRIAWRRSDIEQWARDPEAWRHRQSEGAVG